MRAIAIGGAVLGLVIVLGSQLPQVGEAVGAVALRSDDPSSATASVYAHAPRANLEAPRSADPAVLPEDLTAVVGQYCVVLSQRPVADRQPHVAGVRCGGSGR